MNDLELENIRKIVETKMGDSVARVAHDIRNKTNVISMMIEDAIDEVQDDDIKSNLTKALTSLGRIEEIFKSSIKVYYSNSFENTDDFLTPEIFQEVIFNLKELQKKDITINISNSDIRAKINGEYFQFVQCFSTLVRKTILLCESIDKINIDIKVSEASETVTFSFIHNAPEELLSLDTITNWEENVTTLDYDFKIALLNIKKVNGLLSVLDNKYYSLTLRKTV